MLHRPEPLLAANIRSITATMHPRKAAGALANGEQLVVRDRYSTGLDILNQLPSLLDRPGDSAPYAERQAYEARHREVAERLLVRIERHQIAVENAPEFHYAPVLYPSIPSFALPLIAVQDLIKAWRWFKGGIRMPVLGHSVHPFWGTYAPLRSEHLELFATWLSAYEGRRGSAVDVGTGCGVLAFLLSNAGFASVLATDSNPNAVESVRRELRAHHYEGVKPVVADLLGDADQADLVVFNPPWIPGKVGNTLDAALHYDDPELFTRFFASAHEKLAPEGRVAVVFSNIASLLRPTEPHPLEVELQRGRFELVGKTRRKVKARKGARPGGGKRTKEKVEVWEFRKTRTPQS